KVHLAPGDGPQRADARLTRSDLFPAAHRLPVEEPEELSRGRVDGGWLFGRLRHRLLDWVLTVHSGHCYHPFGSPAAKRTPSGYHGKGSVPHSLELKFFFFFLITSRR